MVSFTRRIDGQTLLAAHINELQSALEKVDNAVVTLPVVKSATVGPQSSGSWPAGATFGGSTTSYSGLSAAKTYIIVGRGGASWVTVDAGSKVSFAIQIGSNMGPMSSEVEGSTSFPGFGWASHSFSFTGVTTITCSVYVYTTTGSGSASIRQKWIETELREVY